MKIGTLLLKQHCIIQDSTRWDFKTLVEMIWTANLIILKNVFKLKEFEIFYSAHDFIFS